MDVERHGDEPDFEHHHVQRVRRRRARVRQGDDCVGGESDGRGDGQEADAKVDHGSVEDPRQHVPAEVVGAEGVEEAGRLEELLEVVGGRLVGVFAMTQPPRAMIVTRSRGDFGSRALFDASVPVLPGLERRPAFVF